MFVKILLTVCMLVSIVVLRYVRDVLYVVLYVRVNCVVVRGCAVSTRCINICNNVVFSVVNMYLDHLKLCVVCINGQRYVCCSECYFVLMSVMSPTPVMCHLPVRTMVKLCTLGVFALRVSMDS